MKWSLVDINCQARKGGPGGCIIGYEDGDGEAAGGKGSFDAIERGCAPGSGDHFLDFTSAQASEKDDESGQVWHQQSGTPVIQQFVQSLVRRNARFLGIVRLAADLPQGITTGERSFSERSLGYMFSR